MTIDLRDCRRLWLLGPCGAGKSTVAERLATVLEFDVIHLDDVHWRPGWRENDRASELAEVDRRTSGPCWIVDGNYSWIRQAFADRVDLFVWFDLSLPLTLARVARRCVRRSIGGERCCNGNRESILRSLFTRDSILLWSVTSFHRLRRELNAELATAPHVRLRGAADAAAWERSILERGRPAASR